MPALTKLIATSKTTSNPMQQFETLSYDVCPNPFERCLARRAMMAPKEPQDKDEIGRVGEAGLVLISDRTSLNAKAMPSVLANEAGTTRPQLLPAEFFWRRQSEWRIPLRLLCRRLPSITALVPIFTTEQIGNRRQRGRSPRARWRRQGTVPSRRGSFSEAE